MRLWIFIFLSLCSCNPQVITQIKEITVHDSIFQTKYIYRDSFRDVSNAKIKQDGYENNSQSQGLVIVKQNTKTIVKNIVKTVYGEPGMLLYDIPDSMILSKIYTIKVRIQKQPKEISKDGTVKPVQAEIKTSRKMEVDLTDPNPTGSFTITRVNASQQIIESDFYTEWIFNVVPTKSGQHSLNLVVSIISEDGIKQSVYQDIIYIKNKISVKIESFWDKHWQWIFSTFLIPVFIYLWRKKQKKESQ